LEKRRAASKPVVTTQLVPAKTVSASGVAQMRTPEAATTGIDRMAIEVGETKLAHEARFEPDLKSQAIVNPEVTDRADSGQKTKTTMPRIAGGFRLPPSSLLHRPDGKQAIDADELKLLAQVLTEKYAEFDVHGQVTQINPGPVVTTFEYKPEA